MTTNRCWLLKSEPDVFSIDDLAKGGRTSWEGVRNYQARNFMRDDMRVGDRVLFYHSNATPPGVAGVAEVCRASYPDPHAFDSKSPYYDVKSSLDAPRWVMVDVAFVARFVEVVSLEAIKAAAGDGGPLEGIEVARKGSRLSVQPVSHAHFDFIVSMAR